MKPIKLVLIVITLAAAHALTACAEAPDSGIAMASSATSAAVASNAGGQSPVESALPLLTVTKSPSCGCCELWVEHMKEAGFPVKVVVTDNLNAVKARVGVPYGKGSCHTAEVDGYFVEGHIPAIDVKRLLAEKPDAKGLVVPGMPAGSPGMEMPDGRVQPYAVELVARDGTTSVFARHGD